jgi:Tfp pilus assembly protein PilO
MFLHRVVICLVTVLVVIGTGYDLMLQRRIKQRDKKSTGK